MAIRIVAIPGSVRPGNYTGKALDLVVDDLRKQAEIEVDRIELQVLARGSDCAARAGFHRQRAEGL